MQCMFTKSISFNASQIPSLSAKMIVLENSWDQECRAALFECSLLHRLNSRGSSCSDVTKVNWSLIKKSSYIAMFEREYSLTYTGVQQTEQNQWHPTQGAFGKFPTRHKPLWNLKFHFIILCILIDPYSSIHFAPLYVGIGTCIFGQLGDFTGLGATASSNSLGDVVNPA